MLWSTALKRAIHDRIITSSDYAAGESEVVLNRALSELTARMRESLPFASIRHKKNGRAFLSITNRLDRIIDQASAAWLKKALHVVSFDRNRQVQGLVASATEYGPARVHRYDISSFFESFDREKIVERVLAHESVTGPVRIALSRYLATAEKFGCRGLPRGLSLSSVLSEYAMKNIDSRLASDPSVYFYGRFVDDLIILRAAADSNLPFREIVESELGRIPGEFVLNEDKSDDRATIRPQGGLDRRFCYLGYEFFPESRAPFLVDITECKAEKLKKKVVAVFVSYLKHKDFRELRETLQILASNTLLIRRGVKSRAMFVGIYYSYPHVTPACYKHGRLAAVDKFIRSLVYGSKTNLSRRLSNCLTKAERSPGLMLPGCCT